MTTLLSSLSTQLSLDAMIDSSHWRTVRLFHNLIAQPLRMSLVLSQGTVSGLWKPAEIPIGHVSPYIATDATPNLCLVQPITEGQWQSGCQQARAV